MDIASEVKRIIHENLHKDLAVITPQASFIDDLDADSLGLVELVLKFEEVFDIEISEEETQAIRTVQDAIDHIERKVKSK